MTSVQTNMDNKSDDHFLIVHYTIYDNIQSSDEKMNTYDSKLDKFTIMTEIMMDYNQDSKSLPQRNDLPND